ncbi:MAG: hypothetical protein ACLRS7_00680 [Acutalibacter sp.]
MKLKQSIRYQLADFIGPVIVYYGIVVAVHILFFLIHNCVNANVMYLGGGMSGFSMVFLFICGLCSFHDNLPMHLQNGVSRKTMYTAWLAVTGIVSAVMAAADTVLATLIDLLDLPIWGYGSANLFFTLFDLDGLAFGQTLVNTLFSILFSFVLLALAMTLGYFIVVFFYRLPVKLRIVVGACAGFLLFFGLPGAKILDTNLLGEGLRAFFRQYLEPVLEFIWENPFALMGTWAVAAVVLSALSWLLMRRTAVAR